MGVPKSSEILRAEIIANVGKVSKTNISSLPSFAKRNSKRPRVGLIAGITVAALVVFSLAFADVFLKRTKYREKLEEWEQDFFWPHRFIYKELRIATSTGQEIAVKCITKEFREGMKGFVGHM